MPIIPPTGLRRLDDKEFERAAYHVMEVVFQIHNEFGRLFDERIYQTEIARRLDGARTRVPVELVFESFRKVYYLDLLYADGAVFELKAADTTVDRHRAQLLNYLLVLDLPHGKLVNLRGELVEHEFVNAPWRRADRQQFDVADSGWTEPDGCAVEVKKMLVATMRDWGVGLENALYEEALTHFLGGEEKCCGRSPWWLVRLPWASKLVGWSIPIPRSRSRRSQTTWRITPNIYAGSWRTPL